MCRGIVMSEVVDCITQVEHLSFPGDVKNKNDRIRLMYYTSGLSKVYLNAKHLGCLNIQSYDTVRKMPYFTNLIAIRQSGFPNVT